MDDHLTLCYLLVAAALIGGAIGLERELKGKHAGLRTNVLICLGAALLTQLSVALASANGDAGRIAAQIVTGIGFLGAGTIIQSPRAVHGLTSAATIWAVAALGIAVGAGHEGHAAVAAGLVLVILALVGRAEAKLLGEQFITVTVSYEQGSPPDAEGLLREAGVRRRLVKRNLRVAADGAGRLTLVWRGTLGDAQGVLAAIARRPGLCAEDWEAEE